MDHNTAEKAQELKVPESEAKDTKQQSEHASEEEEKKEHIDRQEVTSSSSGRDDFDDEEKWEIVIDDKKGHVGKRRTLVRSLGRVTQRMTPSQLVLAAIVVARWNPQCMEGSLSQCRSTTEG